MSFLGKKYSSDITLTVPVDAAKAEELKDSLLKIVENVSLSEMKLLAKAVSNSLVKSQALAELKKLYKE